MLQLTAIFIEQDPKAGPCRFCVSVLYYEAHVFFLAKKFSGTPKKLNKMYIEISLPLSSQLQLEPLNLF